MPSIFFKLESQAYEIDLFVDHAPQTIAKLLATLPMQLDIHCAKIAGQHIFWHAPFVSALEKPQNILSLPTGTFLYWPERQFLELIYGELQAEKAQVCVLGQLKEESSWLKNYGTQVVKQHGHQILSAQLLPGKECEKWILQPQEEIHAQLQWLRDEREKIWQAPPEELFRLMRRHGMMLPYGPLAMAEGELRKLHELLWRLAQQKHNFAGHGRSQILSFLVEAFHARIDGFCGLSSIGNLLLKATNFFTKAQDLPALQEQILEELILYTGRASAWCDAYIPWHDLNEACLDALKNQGIGKDGSKS